MKSHPSYSRHDSTSPYALRQEYWKGWRHGVIFIAVAWIVTNAIVLWAIWPTLTS